MKNQHGSSAHRNTFPAWVPAEAQRYLEHTESGLTIRELARAEGCAPSTVLRQIRKIEQKRDDPLVDAALSGLSHIRVRKPSTVTTQITERQMDIQPKATFESRSFDGATGLEGMTMLALRRLSEAGASLVAAPELEKAVVLRDLGDGNLARTAVFERSVAEMLALREWIAPAQHGKVMRYQITSAGRAALKREIAKVETRRAGFHEAPATFFGAGLPEADDETAKRRSRYQSVESPVLVLSRRRDHDGQPFLNSDLVAASERLREDYELARIGGATQADWDAFLAAPTKLDAHDPRPKGSGPDAAKARTEAALVSLGPDLGDVALRACCYLEGMEQIERAMGWSARSGKIVLRIALQRLVRHYETAGYSTLIG